MRRRFDTTRLSALALGLCVVREPAPVQAEGPRVDPSSEAFAPVGTQPQYGPDRVLDLEHAAIAVVPGPSASTRNPSSRSGAVQRLNGRGSGRPGASSMKNCPGVPG